MAKAFQYLTCQVQSDRATHVDGVWRGTAEPNAENALETCPRIWDYLHEAGRDGWELVTALGETQGHTGKQILFFKRPLDW